MGAPHQSTTSIAPNYRIPTTCPAQDLVEFWAAHQAAQAAGTPPPPPYAAFLREPEGHTSYILLPTTGEGGGPCHTAALLPLHEAKMFQLKRAWLGLFALECSC